MPQPGNAEQWFLLALQFFRATAGQGRYPATGAAVDPAARAFAVTIEALAEETIALIARTTQTAADRDQAYREAVQGLAELLGTALPPELAGAPRRT